MTRRQWNRARRMYNANRRAVNYFLKRYGNATPIPRWNPEGMVETWRIGGSRDLALCFSDQAGKKWLTTLRNFHP